MILYKNSASSYSFHIDNTGARVNETPGKVSLYILIRISAPELLKKLFFKLILNSFTEECISLPYFFYNRIYLMVSTI